MTYDLVEAEKANYPTAVLCRTLGISRSAFYSWRERKADSSAKGRADAFLVERIKQIHAATDGTYGSPRIHQELVLGDGMAVGENRVARLMRIHGIQGIFRRRRRGGCTVRDPLAKPSEDLVMRKFNVDGPDRLWVGDITEHPTDEGKVYIATVLDAWSRRVIGWSIAEHIRSELVVDALQMAVWRRQPDEGKTICHTDHGAQYTSWAFGRRLRAAGILGSMGTIGDCFDNSMAESFFGTLQLELLDRRRWTTRKELAAAVFAYIEGFYNPRRRHSSIGYLSPAEFESRHMIAARAA